MHYCYSPFAEAKKNLQEGDVILCRNSSIWSSFIKASGNSKYSHCCVVTITHGDSCDLQNGGDIDQIIEVVEFREWIGGRIVSLERYLEVYKGEMDVFRPNSEHTKIYFDCGARKLGANSYSFQRKKGY